MRVGEATAVEWCESGEISVQLLSHTHQGVLSCWVHERTPSWHCTGQFELIVGCIDEMASVYDTGST